MCALPIFVGSFVARPAHDPAGHVDHASQPDSADAGQGAPGFPRSRTSLRKSWTSRNRDRPGPFLHDGNGRSSQTPHGMAKEETLVFQLGARVDAEDRKSVV